ncbi:hypothetical protein OPV22_020566 [Ensete ventricosum]|uniref:Uncharacterized protein n=1 Tax=Ensete ventricosum TaxID=4639 RepID=A0AAV8QAR4_ENSVE|nr:hypothetical protein OPV22_020566 [Ensete ventricosum]RWW85725.1 hypothetical protein BHE74_00005575 [Ensete ventricosum]RZS14222.1 hypothetical protein BHM03_00045890 [Ensete ventricosum]
MDVGAFVLESATQCGAQGHDIYLKGAYAEEESTPGLGYTSIRWTATCILRRASIHSHLSISASASFELSSIRIKTKESSMASDGNLTVTPPTGSLGVDYLAPFNASAVSGDRRMRWWLRPGRHGSVGDPGSAATDGAGKRSGGRGGASRQAAWRGVWRCP